MIPLPIPFLPAVLRPAVLLLAAPAAFANESASPGVSPGAMFQAFAGLAFLLVLFIGAAWLARRLGAGNALGGKGLLKIIDGVSISPRERILLVEAGDAWLVIGVGPGQIRTLHTLPRGELPPPGTEGDKFGHWLQRFVQQKNDAPR